MGLSSKQVSVDGLDWEQSLLHAGALELPKPLQVVRPQQQPEQQQQQTPLSCPRCDSTNTKFCYYNNYNRSQPRHFCKACRRHWTKGGTLRNVPVGGGRKNKRVKASSSKNNNYIGSKPQQQEEQLLQHHLSLPFGDQKNLSEILYQALLPPPPSSLPPIPNFPFTSLGSFDNNPSISSPFNGSFQSSNFYDNTGMIETAEDPITTATTTTCAAMSTEMPWQAPNSIGFMDSSTYCGWNDLTGFVTTDVREAWDDYSIQKQQGK